MAGGLDVYCFGEFAGRLTRGRPLEFRYAGEWIAARRPPLSQSLPTTSLWDPGDPSAFFGGLLPEGEPRKILARSLGVSVDDVFGLLEEIGWDCAGAVSVYPEGSEPVPDGDGADVGWLDDEQLAALINDLPGRPLLYDEDGELRLSLAGAQDKLPVVVSNGRVGLSGQKQTPGRRSRTASTHIIKLPINHLPSSVANEALSLRVVSRFNVGAVEAEPRRADGAEYLLVTRYDREDAVEGRVRLHQEDFCQAMGIPSEEKYEAAGGPGLSDCFDLVRRSSDSPAGDVRQLFTATALNFLLGNHDAHGKNFSFIYRADGTRMAPIYDVLSSFVYRSTSSRMTPKLAMKFGGEYRWDWIKRRHFDRMFESAGLGEFQSRVSFLAIADQVTSEVEAVRDDLNDQGWGSTTLDEIVELVKARAQIVAAELKPQPARE